MDVVILGGFGLRRARYDALNPSLELRPRQHHFPVAAQTAYADIRAYPHDAPGIAAAWMRFSHLHDIAGAK